MSKVFILFTVELYFKSCILRFVCAMLCSASGTVLSSETKRYCIMKACSSGQRNWQTQKVFLSVLSCVLNMTAKLPSCTMSQQNNFTKEICEKESNVIYLALSILPNRTEFQLNSVKFDPRIELGNRTKNITHAKII